MKFSKEYLKLQYPIFTTIRQNKGYYKEGQIISISTPKQEFKAEIVGIRKLTLNDITKTISHKDADCEPDELIELMKKFYKQDADNLILLTLMKI